MEPLRALKVNAPHRNATSSGKWLFATSSLGCPEPEPALKASALALLTEPTAEESAENGTASKRVVN